MGWKNIEIEIEIEISFAKRLHEFFLYLLNSIEMLIQDKKLYK